MDHQQHEVGDWVLIQWHCPAQVERLHEVVGWRHAALQTRQTWCFTAHVHFSSVEQQTTGQINNFKIPLLSMFLDKRPGTRIIGAQ